MIRNHVESFLVVNKINSIISKNYNNFLVMTTYIVFLNLQSYKILFLRKKNSSICNNVIALFYTLEGLLIVLRIIHH